MSTQNKEDLMNIKKKQKNENLYKSNAENIVFFNFLEKFIDKL